MDTSVPHIKCKLTHYGPDSTWDDMKHIKHGSYAVAVLQFGNFKTPCLGQISRGLSKTPTDPTNQICFCSNQKQASMGSGKIKLESDNGEKIYKHCWKLVDTETRSLQKYGALDLKVIEL